MANTYLTRTTGTGSRRKFTKSVWFKRSKLGDKQDLFGHTASPNYNIEVQFKDDDTLRFYSYNNSSATVDFVTSRKFIDCNCWYHLVIAVDTEQSTEADRVKIYVNGVQETSFSTADYPTLNEDLEISDGTRTGSIGAWYTGGDPFDGYMSYVAFIDGTQELPTIFGEEDTSTGEWKIKTTITPSSAWGTNGYLILKDGNTITDQSSNSNDWTSNGAGITKSEDNPSNVFCVWNKLTDTFNDKFILANGNTTWNSYSTGSSVSHPIVGTIGLTKGKWYWENYIQTSHGGNHVLVGVTSQIRHTNAQYNHLGSTNQDYAYHGNNGDICNNSGSSNDGTDYGDTFTAGDYIGVFLDLDNNKIYFSKNGTVQNSGTGHSITDPASTFDGCYYPALGDYHYSPSYVVNTNFGNGVFASTALTGTTYNGADGKGIFKYDPTSVTLDGVSKSFNAISTKGLNA